MLTKPQVIGLFKDFWYVPVLAILLISVTFYLFCGDGRNNKNERIESNIDIQRGINGVISNQITNQQGAVNNAETIANQANGNLANARKRDSNSFSGSQSDADNAFCSRNPDDSSCAEWRLRNGR